jgi:hypothetical protein
MSTPIQTNVTPEKKAKPTLKFMRDRDREKVKGIFKFYECPGGTMSFCYKAYKEDPVERFDFIDGGVYSIPLGVAKHLNKNGFYPIHAHTVDESGRPSMSVGTKVRRFGFQSLEFVDIDELEPAKQIITVSNL